MDNRINTGVKARFVNMHFVDEQYHEQHPHYSHMHEDILELFFVAQGNGQYEVDGKSYIVRPGSMVVCNAGIMHGETPFFMNRMESYCCVVDQVEIPGLPPNTLFPRGCNPVIFFGGVETEYIMRALHGIHTQPEPLENVCNLLANALVNLVYIRLLQRRQFNRQFQKNNDEYIGEITRFLDENYKKALTLEELGRRFHIAPSSLSHFFKAETGLAPLKYVMYRRLGEAQSLLMNTKVSLGDIGERLGFCDHSHFSSTFKKYVGITPLQYRQNFQDE